MTKVELVELVKTKTGLRKVDAEAAVKATLESIKETLGKHEKVQVVGFGTFDVRERKGRIGRNPQHPDQTVTIPAKKVPVFKPGKELRELVDPSVIKPAKPVAPVTKPAPAPVVEPKPVPVAKPAPAPVVEPAPAPAPKKTRRSKKTAQ